MPKSCLRFSAAFILCGLAFCPSIRAATGVTPDGLWLDLTQIELHALPQRSPQQSGYAKPLMSRAILLDDDRMAKTLDSAPLENPTQPMKSEYSDSVLWLPMPDGTDVPFSFVEAPIMEPELADRYPEIRTYLGNALDGSNRYVRFDRTPSGFHAFIRGGGDVYIEPSEKDEAYLTYRVSKYSAFDREFSCYVDEGAALVDITGSAKLKFAGTLRTFRLAMACTGEYANFHGSTNETGKENALAAIATAVNRVNEIYEQEVGVRFVLVGKNDQIVFTDPEADPFNANLNPKDLMTESQSVIRDKIKDRNYDIGHTVSTGPGGRAMFGECNDAKKASGCSGLAKPSCDPFVVNFVAHEIGHQLGATHTFNGRDVSCGSPGEWQEGTAFERGSGSTIMGYAGTCGADDLQENSDAYFHSANLEQIASFLISTVNTCSDESSLSNSPPAVVAGPHFTIPRKTPITLTAEGSDTDGDTLRFAWEERDNGPAQALTDPDNGKSPLFRCFVPETAQRRTFPKLASVISDTFTSYEVLPSLARKMKFWVVARDDKGGFAMDETIITVEQNAGPFRVTSPNSGVNLQGGEVTKITWDVANTDRPEIATRVKILLSTDGGYTFQKVLKANTRNDGKQEVTIPNVVTNSARVKVEAVGNVFWDMSNTNFSINFLDIVGTWEEREDHDFGNAVFARETFKRDSTALECELEYGTCHEVDYRWTQTGPSTGKLEFFTGVVGDYDTYFDYDVEIVDKNHLLLTGIYENYTYLFSLRRIRPHLR